MSSNTEVGAKLLTIFHIVNDWLKFAEAKNAGMIVISGAGSAAILTYLASSQSLSTIWKRLLFISVLLFIIGATFSLISFIPRTNLKYILNLVEDWGQPNDTDNLYFFNHLAKYKPDILAATIVRDYFPQISQPASPSKEQCDLAAQIITNSRISVFKFRLFTVAVWTVIIAVVLIIVGLVLQAF